MLHININGSTKLVILIGDPVSHSLSPRMHTAAFQKIGFNAIYLACRVKKDNLKEAINSIKALEIVGANITIPHKVETIKYIDKIDPIAKEIGAINTIINRNGILYAVNTDGIGAIRSLKEAGIELKGCNVLILGSGGASRAISFHLLNEINHLFITNIREKSLSKLTTDLEKKHAGKITKFLYNKDKLKEYLKKCDLLINCTPVGMYPNIHESMVPEEFLREDLPVFDIIYNPIETKLLKDAKKVGARIIYGYKMLLYQGVEGFELWTGKKAPVELMEKILIDELLKNDNNNINNKKG
ncbi:MAG: shikimate dehydrogenase [Candidatus Helarchaeota archaeon]